MMVQRPRAAMLERPTVTPVGVAALAVAWLLVTSLIAPTVASGETRDMTVTDLADSAHTVVEGRVVAVTARADSVSGIARDVTVEIAHALIGQAGARIRFSVPGGVLGDETVYVTESPEFAEGEHVMVFLDDAGRVVGGRQGRFGVAEGRIVETGETTERFTGRVLSPGTRLNLRKAFPEYFESHPMTSSAPEASASPALVTGLVTPTLSGISPAAAPAGTGDTIKLSGSSFGSTKGVVEFFYRTNRPAIVASGSQIKQWTETLIEVEVPTGTVDGYPASAGSGPITVVTAAGSRSNSANFTVTFSYGGAKWGVNTVPYRVYANCADTTEELALVQAGASSWNGLADFAFSYAGATTSPSFNNGVNDVSWGSLPAGVLGQASYRFSGGGILSEADVMFNDTDSQVVWGTGAVGSVTYDIQSVTGHEIGHWLTFRDQYGAGDSGDVMYGSLGRDHRRRTPSAGDIDGIRWIYGAVDNIAPVTTAIVSPSSWTSGNVSISLSAIDDFSGVATTRYKVGLAASQVYSSAVTIVSEGSTTVSYWSTDNAGNVETQRSVVARIDRTPPVSTLAVGGPYYGAASLSIARTDAAGAAAGSGVATTYHRIDGGSTIAGASVSIATTGTHTVEFWSSDAAGNTEDFKTVQVVVLPVPDIALERIAGADRYRTAAAISAGSFNAGSAPTVVLATGAQFADALSASGLAGAHRSPLLLTPTGSLHAAVTAELTRLGALRVVIVGGDAAVSPVVAEKLRELGYEVTRVSGPTRYDTSAAVAREIARIEGAAFGGEAFIARGDQFADALAAAPLAYARRAPVLLVKSTSLPAVTGAAVSDLDISSVVVVGGTGAISSEVTNGLGALSVSTHRVAGTTRYHTARLLAEYAIARGWSDASVIGVTTGEDFPDALGGGAAAGSSGGLVLLTKPGSLSSDAASVLQGCTDDLSRVQVYGGEGAVRAAAYEAIRRIWNLN